MSWRVLSPLAALLWVAVLVGVGGSAQADPGAGSASASHADHGHSDDHGGPTAPPTQVDTGSAHLQTTPGSGNADTSDVDLTQPQSISKADANTGGANGQCPDGPYCSTRDGSASHNGNGGGTATGEPCAGCVGKADNKNPHGQMPNASDANAGYECDTNHGIAKGNPAHTSCISSSPQCVPTETVPCVPPCVPTDEVPCVPPCVPTDTAPCVSPPECVPTESAPCVSPPECVPTQAAPCVPSTTVEAPLPPSAQAAAGPATLTSPSTTSLPNTGAPGHLAALTAVALACLAGGLVLLAGRRQGAGS